MLKFNKKTLKRSLFTLSIIVISFVFRYSTKALSIQQQSYYQQNGIFYYNPDQQCIRTLENISDGDLAELPNPKIMKEIYQYLSSNKFNIITTNGNLSQVQKAAIIGNILAESGGVTSTDYCDNQNGSSCSYGIFQHKGNRLKKMLSMAGKTKPSSLTIKEQMDYFRYEIETNGQRGDFFKLSNFPDYWSNGICYKHDKRIALSNGGYDYNCVGGYYHDYENKKPEDFAVIDNLKMSTAIFGMLYEAPNKNAFGLEKRLKYAKAVLNTFGGSSYDENCNNNFANSKFDGKLITFHEPDNMSIMKDAFNQGYFVRLSQLENNWTDKDSEYSGTNYSSMCTEISARMIAMNLLQKDYRPYAQGKRILLHYNPSVSSALSNVKDIKQDKDQSSKLKTNESVINYIKQVLSNKGLVYYYATTKPGCIWSSSSKTGDNPFHNNHAIVIRGYDGNNFIVGDPAYKETKWPAKKFLDCACGKNNDSKDCSKKSITLWGAYKK